MQVQILIADSDPLFASALSDLLVKAGYHRPYTTTRMRDALYALRRRRVQILITDLILEAGTGWELLEQIAFEQLEVGVVVLTALWSRSVREDLQARGVRQVARKPVSNQVILQCVAACCEGQEQMLVMPKDSERACLRTLAGLGMRPCWDGMLYMQYGLRLMRQSDRWVRLRVTKELYPEIAHHMRVRTETVEASVRYALRRAWEEGDRENWRRLCEQTGRSNRRPTASELFWMLIEWVSMYPDGGFP